VAETVGSLVDKITIIELKIFHMREQATRRDVDDAFRERCDQRLAVMREQRDDLTEELTQLVSDIRSGRRVPKIYRQFKMYNDPQFRSPASPRSRAT
jgi:Protein of unknown function (DUF4254)